MGYTVEKKIDKRHAKEQIKAAAWDLNSTWCKLEDVAGFCEKLNTEAPGTIPPEVLTKIKDAQITIYKVQEIRLEDVKKYLENGKMIIRYS